MTGLEIIDRSNRNQTAGYAVKEAAAVYGMLVLVFAAYFSVFEVYNRIAEVFLLPIPAAGIAVWAGRRKNRIYICFLAGASAVLLAVTPWNFMNGLSCFANSYILLNNEFYGVSQPLLEVEKVPADMLAALLGIQILLALLLKMAGISRQRAIGNVLVILVSILPVAAAATVGKMPSEAASWCLLGGTILYFYWRKCGSVSWREGAGILVTLGILFGCTQVFMPFIRSYKTENEDRLIEVHNRLTEMQQIDVQGILEERFGKEGAYSGGGIAKGNLENLSEFKPSGEKALEITVTEKPGETLYLRAYTGVNYTGKAWEKESNSEFRKGMPSVSGEADRRALMNEPYTRISEGAASPKQQTITIRREGASSDYSYVPYFAEVKQNDKIYLDSWVKGRWTDEREFPYFQLKDAEGISSEDLAKESEIWEEYRTFVKEEYSLIPDGLEKLKALSRSVEQSNVDRLSDEINRLFEETLGLRYSKSPGEVPEGEEFTEYFLTENRKGFCVHFASAATLIYRACGYPSRFVEGYAVPTGAFIRENDGTYRAVVTDEMAHAWCETFDDEIGWVVREHTPSYLVESDVAGGTDDWEDEAPEDTMNEDEPENENQPQEENQPTQPEMSADDTLTAADDTMQKMDGGENRDIEKGGNESDSLKIVFRKVAVGTASAAGAVFLVMFLFVIFRSLGRQKRYAGFRRRRENQGIANLYQAMYEICLFDGMEPDPESERMTLEKMKVHFTQLTEEEWEWMYLCAERAAFSGEEISKEELKKMFRLYQKFRRAYLKTLSRKKRFWFLYGKGL
ncbi:MAG: transglutaminase family protein [Bariatricus sp.]